MRANGDADYELSLSDSEEEAITNDESSDDQTGSQNHVAAIPAMQRQQHLVFLPCYVVQGLLNFQENRRQSIAIRLPRERSGHRLKL